MLVATVTVEVATPLVIVMVGCVEQDLLLGVSA